MAPLLYEAGIMAFLHILCHPPLGMLVATFIYFDEFGAYATNLEAQHGLIQSAKKCTELELLGEEPCAQRDSQAKSQQGLPHGKGVGSTRTRNIHVQEVDAPREDDPGLPGGDRRVQEPDLMSPYTTQSYPHDIPGYNHAATSHGHETPPNGQTEDNEMTWFMQTQPEEPAWLAYLRVTQERLEDMPKAHRALVADGLLRRLDWFCTNSRDGYFLGHMGGRTAMLTALLVVARGDTELDSEAILPTEVLGIWHEATFFLNQHPGSRCSQGRGVSLASPTIMMHYAEAPSVTPENSPLLNDSVKKGVDQDLPARENPTKRLRVRVEISSGSSDTPQLTGNIDLPFQNNCSSLKVKFTVQPENDTNSTCTVPATPTVAPCGATLLPPAPGGFAEMGISLLDYWRLQEEWQAQTITETELVTNYGRGTADQLIQSWRQVVNQAHDRSTQQGSSADDQREQRGDETTLLDVTSLAGMMSTAVMARAMEAQEDFLGMAKEHLHRLRGEGWTRQQQASTLWQLVQERGSRDYETEFPDMLEELDLPVDVNMHERCLPGPTPFMRWVEMELWELFVDRYEATMGFETEGVMRLRDGAVMTQEERDEWRRWAGLQRRSPRSRSRSPRRSTRMPQEQRRDPDAGDHLSLMHRGDWPHPTGRGSRRRRARREAPRSRSRGTTHARAGNREERVRQRLTEETRWLTPRGCRWAEWTEEPGSEPASSHRDAPQLALPSAATTSADGEMDLIQATSEWLRAMGLRRPGQEHLEPSNALTQATQREMREMLRRVNEASMVQMYRSLMRIMGMLFIEATRILIDEGDERRRGTDLVEVHLEDDDESLYMQTSIATYQRDSWEVQLQRLVGLTDKGGPIERALVQGLLRRIGQSLFLHTPRGAQLQAALVAVRGATEDEPESCETRDNDRQDIDKWWNILKDYMDLGRTETQARGSDEHPGAMSGGRPSTAPTMVTQADIDSMEADQMEMRSETAQLGMQLAEREAEEARQSEHDLLLFEEHERRKYRDWEAWTVIHEPVIPKRRRLVLTGHQTKPPLLNQGDEVERTSIPVPSNLSHFHATLHFAYVQEPTDGTGQTTTSGKVHPGGQLEIGSETFQRARKAWRAGIIGDEGIRTVFGDEWLFFLRLEKQDGEEREVDLTETQEGAEDGSTLNHVETTGDETTEPAEGSQGGGRGELGTMSGWNSYRLREGDFVIALEDSETKDVEEGDAD